MKNLLSLKHWQLFLLIFICGAWTSPSPLKEIINSVAVVTFTLWLYAIGVNGQERISELGLKPMNLKLFKTNLVIVGTFFLVGLTYSAIRGDVHQTPTGTVTLNNVIYAVGGLYLVLAMIQVIIFACKTIAKLEYRREVFFSDYSNNIFLMLFFFVGIWYLQPKVNRLITTEEEKVYS